MTSVRTKSVTVKVSDAESVSGLLHVPPQARAGYVLAHGAGAGMTHPFMAAMADGLAERGIATLRFQFPYMEKGSRRPDSPERSQATVRAAADYAARELGELPLFAGGRSFGGRMSSQAQAAEPLPGVRGLIFLGFPLHPAKQPSTRRAQHLSAIRIPMAFFQGTRDELADLALLEGLGRELGGRATLRLFPEADHAFHVPARTGRKDADVRTELLNAVAEWVDVVLARRS